MDLTLSKLELALRFSAHTRTTTSASTETTTKSTSSSARFTCPTCDITFYRQSRLMGHIVRNHLPLSCHYPNCGKVFKAHASLVQHLNLHLGTYTCQQCGRALVNERTFRAHVERHQKLVQPTSGNTQLPVYPCTLCPRRFPSAVTLTEHQKGHSEVKRYKCSLCSRAYKGKHGLRFHTRSIHDGVLPFGCEHCGKRFNQKHQLTGHLRNRHAEVDVGVERTSLGVGRI